ncbi:MAG: PEP-CTERM sorting domain-containing protein, partial [Akkermansiaceae bacterium]|nr:PEP-CTERM sorting domain-containing protein [Akkermansiaceae bacterium]
TASPSYNDAAYFVLNGSANLLADTTSSFIGASSIVVGSMTGYQSYSMPLAAGTHTISFVVTDVFDEVVDSALQIDSIGVIPEPGSAMLSAIAMLGLLARRRR